MTDYRTKAETPFARHNAHPSTVPAASLAALLAIHDLLDERLPKPEPKRCDATFSLVGDEQFECALTPGHGGNHVECDGIVVWSDPPTPDLGAPEPLVRESSEVSWPQWKRELLYEEVWDAAVPPGGYICSTCGTPVETEPCPDHAPDDPGEALAKVLYEFDRDITRKGSPWESQEDDFSKDAFREMARVAREHIEQEQGNPDTWNQVIDRANTRAEHLKAEVDALRAECKETRDERNEARKELRQRELHHFEEEQKRIEAEAEVLRLRKAHVETVGEADRLSRELMKRDGDERAEK